MNRRQFLKTAAVCAATGAAAPELYASSQKSAGKPVRGKVAKNSGPVATPLVEEGKIYTLAASSFLEIDLESGKTLREKRLKGKVQVTTRVLKTEKHFIFGSVKQGLVALDRKTLDVAWHGAVGNAIAPYSAYSKKPQRCVGTAPLLLPNGTVCASANDGAIHFWREADGKHLKELRTGAPYFADAVMKDGALYTADSAGYVRKFIV